MVPSTSDAATQWGFVLNDAVWGRYTINSSGNTVNSYNAVTTSNDLEHHTAYSCPTEAKKLQTWYTSANFVTYVDSLYAVGNTYHDIA